VGECLQFTGTASSAQPALGSSFTPGGGGRGRTRGATAPEAPSPQLLLVLLGRAGTAGIAAALGTAAAHVSLQVGCQCSRGAKEVQELWGGAAAPKKREGGAGRGKQGRRGRKGGGGAGMRGTSAQGRGRYPQQGPTSAPQAVPSPHTISSMYPRCCSYVNTHPAHHHQPSRPPDNCPGAAVQLRLQLAPRPG
jgi:hypothetical protein